MMCAIEAGRRGRRVVLLDHAERVGKKILISGGGRCNFTNIHCRPENFLSENPHFAKSALARFTPADIIAMVERHGIRYHEKTLGQLFCDRSAHDVVTMLERECADAGVRIIVGARVTLRRPRRTFSRADIRRPYSKPRQSSSPQAACRSRRWAPQHSATVSPNSSACASCRADPALVPLVFSAEDREHWCDLAGVSAEVVATAGTRQRRGSFREKMLVTHRGLSGPAILQASSYWRPGEAIALDLAPDVEVMAPSADPQCTTRCRGGSARNTRRAASPNGRAMGRNPSAGRLDQCLSRSHGAATACLANNTRRNRGLCQSRGNRRRRRHRRAGCKDDAEPQGARPVLHRRGGGRNRMAGRIQLPVGMGLGSQRGPGRLKLTSR